MRLLFYEGAMNYQKRINLMLRRIKDTNKIVYLILDNLAYTMQKSKKRALQI